METKQTDLDKKEDNHVVEKDEINKTDDRKAKPKKFS